MVIKKKIQELTKKNTCQTRKSSVNLQAYIG